MWLGGFLVLLVLGAGCGRGPIPEPPDQPALAPSAVSTPAAESGGAASTVPPAPAELVPPPPLPPPAPATEIRVLGEEESEIAVRAITDSGDGGVRIGVVNKASGGSALLSVGEDFAGYTLTGYDPQKEMVLFVWKGENVGMFMTSASAPEAVAGAGGGASDRSNAEVDVPMGGPPDRIDLRDVDQDNFTPTEAERKQGIDPNKPDTWPEGYRGPVIERLLQKQREAGIEPETAPPGIFPAGPVGP